MASSAAPCTTSYSRSTNGGARHQGVLHCQQHREIPVSRVAQLVPEQASCGSMYVVLLHLNMSGNAAGSRGWVKSGPIDRGPTHSTLHITTAKGHPRRLILMRFSQRCHIDCRGRCLTCCKLGGTRILLASFGIRQSSHVDRKHNTSVPCWESPRSTLHCLADAALYGAGS